MCSKSRSGARLGDLVVRADHVRKVYGQRLIMDKVSFNPPARRHCGRDRSRRRQDHLLRMIVGEEQPDGGTLEIGPTVVLST